MTPTVRPAFKVTSPAPEDVWQTLIKSAPDSVVSQSLAWRDAIVASGRYKDASLLYEFPSGQQVILPMAARRGRPPWEPMAASWPRAWGVGGPISREGRIEPVEAAAVLRHVARRDLLGTAIHLSHAADPVWLREAAHWFRIRSEPRYVLDLAGGIDEIWQRRFRGGARRAVRKAERSGLDIEMDRSGRLLRIFYNLYEKSIERWSAKQHEPLWFTKWLVTHATPLSMLALVAKHFGEDCTTWVARSGADPVAAIIVLQHGSHAEYWRGAMDKERAAPLRPNQLLHRLAIEEACRNGCRSYDMGYAGPGSSLARFKEDLGAALHFTHHLHTERLPIYRATQFSKQLIGKMIVLRHR